MKFIFTFILVLFTFSTNAQDNNVLIFQKDSFVNTEPAPYGEKLVIKGESELEVRGVEIRVFYGINEQLANAEINGRNWTAIVGPFPMRAKLIFIIKEKGQLPELEIQRIKTSLETAIDSTSARFIDKEKSMTINEFNEFVIDNLNKLMQVKWKKLITQDGRPLDSVILSLVEKLLIQRGLSILNGLNDLKKITDTQIYKALKEKKESTYLNKEGIIRLCNLNDDELKKLFERIAPDSVKKQEALKTEYESNVKGNYKNYKNAKSPIDSLFTGLDILRNETVVASINTSHEILGIQSYVGVDLGVTYLPKWSVTPFFVTLNPYFLKTDPEIDYKLTCKTFWPGIWHFITPTLGFGLSDVKGSKPVYFVGIGIRLNKIARFSLGGTYYLPPEKEIYDWGWGFTASISVNYISDLLKLIANAQSNIK